MIQSFRHKGLETFFYTGSTRGITRSWANRLRVRLDKLNAAVDVEEMDVPGWDLHELKGDRKGTWALKVTGNWRLTFTFISSVEPVAEGPWGAFDVDLEDYH